ncbi:MAG: aminotransferase class V-fold PLP-dependent enzyme, partial [Spirochaetota bacterium]
SGDRVVYLDNAATSWPKPPVVARSIVDFMDDAGGNPGRSGHRLSIAAGRVVAEARDAVASCLGVDDPLRIAFAHNATAAINTALYGFLKPGDRVVADGNTHNALARPLADLARRGVEVEWAPCTPDGTVLLEEFERLARHKPTRMIAVTHGSNVSGALTPLPEAAAIAGRTGAVLLVDAAQTAGTFPIDLDRLGRAVLAFTGHKAMLGPGGTGGLAFGSGLDIEAFQPFMRGGTGSKSESEDHPLFMPDRFEAGTHNGPGLAGLLAGLRWLEEQGRDGIRNHEARLTRLIMEGLQGIAGIRVHGPMAGPIRCPVVSFTADGLSPSAIAMALDDGFGVLCRVGLHCAPRAHRNLGTFPEGTVRWSPGPFTTIDDVAYTIEALKAVMVGRGLDS